jgi:DNA-binding MurR/RpiR family transcriptional regulator
MDLLESISTTGPMGVAQRYAPCLVRLRAVYPQLTLAERRVSDHLFGNPARVVQLSIAQLARDRQVGVATIARLCAKLGYAGFPEMKTALAVELLSPDYSAPDPIQRDDDASSVARKVLDIGAQTLKDTLALLDPAELGRAADAIVRSTRVECYATGGMTGPIAQIAQHRLLMAGIAATAILDQAQQVASADLLRDGAVAIGLSNSGESKPVAAALSIAREMGATAVCITSVPDSTIARAATIRLLTATRETWFWSDPVASRVPMLGMVDALYACVALLQDRDSAARREA